MDFGSNGTTGPTDHWPDFGALIDALPMSALLVLMGVAILLVVVYVVRKIDANHLQDTDQRTLHDHIRAIVAACDTNVVSIEYVAARLSLSLAATVDALYSDLPAGLSLVNVQLLDSRYKVAVALTIVPVMTGRVADVDAYAIAK